MQMCTPTSSVLPPLPHAALLIFKGCVRVRACACLSACPPSSLPQHSLPTCASAVWCFLFFSPRGPSKNQAADFQIPLPCLFPLLGHSRCLFPTAVGGCWSRPTHLICFLHRCPLYPSFSPHPPVGSQETSLLASFRFSSPAANSSMQLRPPVEAAPPDVDPGASLDAHTVKHTCCVLYAQRTCCCLVYALNLHMHALASHTYGRSPSPSWRPLLLSQAAFIPPKALGAFPLLLASEDCRWRNRSFVRGAEGQGQIFCPKGRSTLAYVKGRH